MGFEEGCHQASLWQHYSLLSICLIIRNSFHNTLLTCLPFPSQFFPIWAMEDSQWASVWWREWLYPGWGTLEKVWRSLICGQKNGDEVEEKESSMLYHSHTQPWCTVIIHKWLDPPLVEPIPSSWALWTYRLLMILSKVQAVCCHIVKWSLAIYCEKWSAYTKESSDYANSISSLYGPKRKWLCQ